MNPEEATATTLEEVARRYDDRPGFKVVDCKDVVLPVYRITVQALTLLHKPVPPIEEFVLKAVDTGLSSEDDISAFLGLEHPVTKNALYTLRMSDDIDLVAPPGSQIQEWRLTKKGERTLCEAEVIVPEETTFEIYFDGLLRRTRWYKVPELLRPRDVKTLKIMEIPPLPPSSPELEDLRLEEVDGIIRKTEEIAKSRQDKSKKKRNLLKLKAIERRERFFQPAIALVYRAKDGDAVQVAFVIDGRLKERT